MTQITENRTNECKQVRKSTVVVYEEAYEEFKNSGFTTILRDENRTIEETVALAEKAFRL